MLFHVGVREPSAKGICRRRQGPPDDEAKIQSAVEKKERRSKSLPLKEASMDNNCNCKHASKANPSHVNLSYENEEEKNESTVPPVSSSEVTGDSDNAKALREMLQQTLSEENMSRENQGSDTDSLGSISFDGYNSEGWSSGHETTDIDSDNFELFMPETFVDMVPFHSNVILSSRRNSKATGIGQFIASSRGPSRTASKKSRRSPAINRRASNDCNDTPVESRRGSRITTHGLRSDLFHPDSRRSSKATTHGIQHSDLYRRSSNMYQQSPLTNIDDSPALPHHPGILSISRQNSQKTWENGRANHLPSRNMSLKKSPLAASDDHSPSCPRKWETPRKASIMKSPLTMETSSQDQDCDVKAAPKVRLSLTPEHITDSFIINTIEDEDLESYVKEKKTWISVLKNPRHFKLGFAYMFTRLAQNVTTAYMPLFLTDHLQYDKMAIAYFPIVILVSGVVASFGGKKLNTILGNKWTFCLGSIMVMGASGWFYLLTQENRLVTFVPAVLSGCGTSIMFVTTLALAAEFVDADRESGAFLMASMGFLSKIVTGILFCLLQEFAPEISDHDYVRYTHYVFSLTPGVSAMCGLVAFIVFIPATIQCKPIIETEDAETQTDETSFASTESILEVIEENDLTTEEYDQVLEGSGVIGNEIIKHEMMENIKEEETDIEEESESDTTENTAMEKIKEEEEELEQYDTAM